jgi:hypothetical protein
MGQSNKFTEHEKKKVMDVHTTAEYLCLDLHPTRTILARL